MARLVAVLAFLIFFVPHAAHAEARIALVIGNAGYDESLGALANPVNDATAIGETLKSAGFDVELVTNADQKTMKRAIQRFGERISKSGRNATGLFYYAGHGMQTRGINYLIPVAAPIAREADLELEAVAADTVISQMEYYGAATSIVILDACRNMPLTRGLRSATRGLAKMEAPATHQSYIAYSASPGQTALDGEGERNSPFAAALVKRMKEPGVPIEQMFKKVRGDVKAASGDKQDPQDSSSLVDEFVFVVNVNITVSPGQSTAAAGPTSPAGVTGVQLTDFANVPTTTAGDMKVSAIPYLHAGAHPLKVRDVLPAGSEIVFMNNRALYEGRAVIPTISQNILTQINTGNIDAAFTLVLPEPASRVQFLVPRLFPDTQSGVTFPAWTATALSASGEALDVRKRALARRMEDDIPGDVISLDAPAFEGIAAIRFESDPRLQGRPFAAFSGILIEGLWFVPIKGQKR